MAPRLATANTRKTNPVPKAGKRSFGRRQSRKLRPNQASVTTAPIGIRYRVHFSAPTSPRRLSMSASSPNPAAQESAQNSPLRSRGKRSNESAAVPRPNAQVMSAANVNASDTRTVYVVGEKFATHLRATINRAAWGQLLIRRGLEDQTLIRSELGRYCGEWFSLRYQ